MPYPSFPEECFNNLLSFLDNSTLYNCLFINRYLCRLSVPLIWRDPFRYYNYPSNSLISTLLSCLNGEEYFPSAVHFNNQTPLFEYGKFIKIIRHESCVNNIINWLDSLFISNSSNSQNKSSKRRRKRIQNCVNDIYHIIIQGSNLQKLVFIYHYYFPKISIFITYKTGIANLKSLNIGIDMSNSKAIEFLSIVSKFCNRIVNCELSICITEPWELNRVLCVKPLLNFFMSQPLEKLLVKFPMIVDEDDEGVKKITDTLDSLKFRSETLKELIFDGFDLQCINLSFISKLERLERLEFVKCAKWNGFASQYYEALFKNKCLKRLKLWYNEVHFYDYYNEFNGFGTKSDFTEAIINSLCGEALLKLSLNIITPETIRAVKKSCPNISHLRIKIYSTESLKSIIQLICELSSLKILNIGTECSYDIDDYHGLEHPNLLVRTLGDYLTSVECLLLDTYMDLSSFEYFVNNCKANLKKLAIEGILRDEWLKWVDNFQSVHKYLKLFGIMNFGNRTNWTNSELEIIDSLKNQGVDIVSSRVLFEN